MASDFGKEFKRTDISVDKDGNFKIDGLHEANYVLRVHANEKKESVGNDRRPLHGFFVQRINVPPREESPEPVDLGEIILQLQEATPPAVEKAETVKKPRLELD